MPSNGQKVNYRLCQTPFKTRYNHTQNFKHPEKTALNCQNFFGNSKEVGKLQSIF